MKRCPTCQRSFDDDSLSFCLEDGTPLVTEGGRGNSQETLVSPRPPGAETGRGSAPPQTYGQLPGKSTVSASPYRPPETPYGPPSGGRKTWPWVVGVLAILSVVVVGILIVVFTVPGVLKSENANGAKPSPARTETATPTPNPSPSSDVPTDSDEVLSQLTQLEKDWTEANYKGDKEALEKILADEFVSKEENARTKREYIDNLKPDDSVEEWEIYDLKVTQTGERAVVNGSLKQVTADETQVWEFVDTFVWRDRRWQAVTSHSSRVK